MTEELPEIIAWVRGFYLVSEVDEGDDVPVRVLETVGDPLLLVLVHGLESEDTGASRRLLGEGHIQHCGLEHWGVVVDVLH